VGRGSPDGGRGDISRPLTTQVIPIIISEPQGQTRTVVQRVTHEMP
jgi:hypothetical protein